MNIAQQVNLANQLFLKGNVDEALKEYKNAYKLKPDDIIIRENMALVLIAKGKYNEAEELLGDNPNYGSACNLLGNIYFYKRDLLNAKIQYEKAVSMDPNCGDAWSNLGNIYFEFKEFNKAEDCCKRSVEINPNNPYWHINLGKALLAQNKLEQAIESYKKTISIDPGIKGIKEILCNVYNKLAGIKLLKADYIGVHALYEECKKSCPDVDFSKYPDLFRFR